MDLTALSKAISSAVYDILSERGLTPAVAEHRLTLPPGAIGRLLDAAVPPDLHVAEKVFALSRNGFADVLVQVLGLEPDAVPAATVPPPPTEEPEAIDAPASEAQPSGPQLAREQILVMLERSFEALKRIDLADSASQVPAATKE